MMRPIGIASPHDFQSMGGYGLPLSETTTGDTAADLLPMYSSPLIDSLSPKTPLKSDNGLTYNMPPLLSRKPSRDSSYGQILPYAVQRRDRSCGSNFSFLGEDISLQSSIRWASIASSLNMQGLLCFGFCVSHGGD